MKDDVIAALREQVLAASPAELPGIIGQVEAIKAEAFARLMTPAPEKQEDTGKLLTADEVAARLQESSRWVRAHADQLGRVRLGGRKLRFSEKRLEAIIKKRSFG